MLYGFNHSPYLPTPPLVTLRATARNPLSGRSTNFTSALYSLSRDCSRDSTTHPAHQFHCSTSPPSFSNGCVFPPYPVLQNTPKKEHSFSPTQGKPQHMREPPELNQKGSKEPQGIPRNPSKIHYGVIGQKVPHVGGTSIRGTGQQGSKRELPSLKGPLKKWFQSKRRNGDVT